MQDLSVLCVCVYRELRAKFKTLARLMDAEEYEKFIASLKSELLGTFPNDIIVCSSEKKRTCQHRSDSHVHVSLLSTPLFFRGENAPTEDKGADEIQEKQDHEARWCVVYRSYCVS